jgi:uncharacterized protein (DUF2249 family)
MNVETVSLDVREDIRNGREPFSKIIRALDMLESGQQLLLKAPFEPVPLFSVLTRRGFAHRTREIGAGAWEVTISRAASDSAGRGVQGACVVQEDGGGCAPGGLDGIIEVDARGLEPPQPLVTILEAVAALPEHRILLARTDRRPMHLYPELEARGFAGRTEEQSDGSFITHIRRS